ncbi:MAG: QueT transporter family protein [Lachnospiraceae bacterium]|nr:QueT transporter family protein [Lachnospiraceae bacterium]
MKFKNSVLYMTQAALIAALYVVITWYINAFNLANGAIQLRLSEAMTVLPVFTPAAIPGLFVGCLLSNTLTGCVVWDIVFGSLATLIGAIGTGLLRKTKFIYTLPPVVSNMFIVPAVLKYAYGLGDSYWYLVLTVGIGEAISVCVFGFLLKNVLDKSRNVIFKEDME